MIIQEQALERFVLCPLMTPTSPSKEEICAYALASWALHKSFEGKFRGDPAEILHIMRGKILELMEGEPNAGHLARTTAFKLFTLIMDYEVLQLEQPYNLILAGYTIQGKYALLRKRKGACLPYVLILHDKEPDLKHDMALPPDVTTLSRYVHVCTNTKYKDAQVIHYPVLQGKPWYNKGLNISLAKQYLEDMLKVVALRPRFPVLGEHCTSCFTKPCMEIFSGQDDNSRSGREG